MVVVHSYSSSELGWHPSGRDRLEQICDEERVDQSVRVATICWRWTARHSDLSRREVVVLVCRALRKPCLKLRAGGWLRPRFLARHA